MDNGRKTYWFPAKRYGWGWGFPSTWQGWITSIVFIVAVTTLPFVIDPNDDTLLFSLSIVGYAVVFLGVCYTKGEPPKWRWGSSDDNPKNGEP